MIGSALASQKERGERNYREQAITRFDRWSMSVMAILRQPLKPEPQKGICSRVYECLNRLSLRTERPKNGKNGESSFVWSGLASVHSWH
jgi:hypothetical protein